MILTTLHLRTLSALLLILTIHECIHSLILFISGEQISRRHRLPPCHETFLAGRFKVLPIERETRTFR